MYSIEVLTPPPAGTMALSAAAALELQGVTSRFVRKVLFSDSDEHFLDGIDFSPLNWNDTIALDDSDDEEQEDEEDPLDEDDDDAFVEKPPDTDIDSADEAEERDRGEPNSKADC